MGHSWVRTGIYRLIRFGQLSDFKYGVSTLGSFWRSADRSLHERLKGRRGQDKGAGAQPIPKGIDDHLRGEPC